MIRRFTLLILLFCCGCTTLATGPLFKPAAPPPSNAGTLYVFRSNVILGGSAPLVQLNGQPFVYLPAMGYSYAYLAPGVYRLTFERAGFKYFIAEVEIIEDEELYVFFNEPMSTMTELNSEDAAGQFNQYRYVDPISIAF